MTNFTRNVFFLIPFGASLVRVVKKSQGHIRQVKVAKMPYLHRSQLSGWPEKLLCSLQSPCEKAAAGVYAGTIQICKGNNNKILATEGKPKLKSY